MDHIRIALRNCPHIVDLSLICLPEHGLLVDLPPDETVTQRSRRPIHFPLLSTLRLQFLGEVSIQATMSILSFPTSAFVDVLDYFHPTVLHLLDGNPAWAKHAFSRITSLVAEDVGGDRGLTSLLVLAYDEPVFRLISRLALDRPTFLIAFQQAPITSLRLSSMFQAAVGEQRWHFATILRAFPELRALELYGPIVGVFTLFTDHGGGLMDESCRAPGEEPRIVCPRLAHLKLTILVDQACRLRVPLVDGQLDAAAAHVRDGYFKPLAYILACRTRLGAARLQSLQVTLEWAAERASDGVVELDGGACEVPADLRGCVDGPVVVEATGRLRFK
ncbi:uncharacterized protein BXZ73DRAFT_106216 [Epithele typhae]|uniref:uncharacterized protein n=1 Tax=Epithele typhae TaxID=378194 RepID=UPI002007C673|nr:uncharacterized protein BXZ73DRAFT_106216 [Epithele typhae]KAH9915242.1 hypothetical protein BXZ73DRAFT_106216 [Epithele typhae]